MEYDFGPMSGGFERLHKAFVQRNESAKEVSAEDIKNKQASLYFSWLRERKDEEVELEVKSILKTVQTEVDDLYYVERILANNINRNPRVGRKRGKEKQEIIKRIRALLERLLHLRSNVSYVVLDKQVCVFNDFSIHERYIKYLNDPKRFSYYFLHEAGFKLYKKRFTVVEL